jgi:hypothetical protein
MNLHKFGTCKMDFLYFRYYLAAKRAEESLHFNISLFVEIKQNRLQLVADASR